MGTLLRHRRWPIRNSDTSRSPARSFATSFIVPPPKVRAKARHAIEVCRESGAGLCLFTSNTVNPDVPLENFLAIYEAAQEEG